MGRKLKPTRFASAIRQAREKLNLRQIEIARRLGSSQSFIPMLEAGERGIDLDVIPRLAGLVQINPQHLLKLYLYETSPVAFSTLFPDEAPELIPKCERPAPPDQDVLARVLALPADLQWATRNLIDVLFERFVS